MLSSRRTTSQQIQSVPVQKWIHTDSRKVGAIAEGVQSLLPEQFLPTGGDHVSIYIHVYKDFNHFSKTVLFSFSLKQFFFLSPRIKTKKGTYCVDPKSHAGKYVLTRKLQ